MSTAAVSKEKAKLQRHFGRFELVTYLVCSLVSVDTVGSVASSGAQGFTWLLFLGLAFFLPYGLLISEVGSTFTDEGGPYVWTRDAFGKFVGALGTVMYWVSNPIWLGGTLTVMTIEAWKTLLGPLPGLTPHLLGLAFIWTTVLMSVVSFRVGKWIAVVGTWGRLVLIPFFTVSVVLYALQHGLRGFPAKEFLPTYTAFIAVVPVLVFNYVGFELPNSAGEEMKDPKRDVPVSIAQSGIGTILLYGIPSLAVLLVLPREQVTGLGGFLDAIKAVFTVYGGQVADDGTATLTGWGLWLGAAAAALFILTLASAGATWLMGADRVVAVAALDGAGPPALGRFSAKYGTPVLVNVLSGVVSAMVMVVSMQLAEGNAKKLFDAVLGLAISTTTLSYLVIFPAAMRLRALKPDVPRPYTVPGGRFGLLACGWLTTFWSLLATVCLLWPGFGVGWFGTGGNPDDSLPEGWAGQRFEYELTQIFPLIVILVLGVVFYLLRRREEGNRRS